MNDGSGIWAYAVADRMTPGWFAGLAGVAGQPVEVLTAAGLAAAVSTVSLAEFGEAALRRHLEDLDWLETTARAHHQVVAEVAEHVPAIPLRLATVYRDRDRLGGMLAARQPDFAAAIGRVTARTEWGVKVFAAGQDAAAAGAASAGGDTERPGTAYLRRRRTQLDAGAGARRAAAGSAEAIHATLGGLAAATDVRPPQAPQLTGRREQMILNGTYLVDDDRSAEFAAAVDRLAGSHQPVRVELTGPWPPYSFAYVGDSYAGAEGSSEPGDDR